ncbi:MAG TPA: glycoside hydrolase family 15 protein [Nitrolancea sp.]|nr:glycoside hydrolase family 15 protein [Nitrolancea sp.]
MIVSRFVPYPAIEQHACIGDRRTAALVAADGTIDWLCYPHYDGSTVFGALLDADRGGFWRLGPAVASIGPQAYLDDSAIAVTRWEDEQFDLELTDGFAWPEDEREQARPGQLALLRRLTCRRGSVRCVHDLAPHLDFGESVLSSHDFADHGFSIWTSVPNVVNGDLMRFEFELHEGESAWMVLEYGGDGVEWTTDRANRLLDETLDYWRRWARRLQIAGHRRAELVRSAITVHLLSYAPDGSMVAAPTTSLPERVGGDRNYDYRFAWVRDASLSMAALALLGDTRASRRYMDWLARLGSSTDSPLQVVYRIDGSTWLTQRERFDLSGYRESRPVRFGNHAAQQLQLDSLGYLADCALIYLNHGGEWNEQYRSLLQQAADYVVARWQRPDSGIWELTQIRHYVSSKVMSWVTLERAIRIAQQTGHPNATDEWQATMELIHADVMEHGWSARLGVFRQCYESDSLDASALLIPVMGFLPVDHPRVVATIRAIEERLTLDGLVHRFVAAETPEHGDLPVGEFEGAFLPCTFWLATTYARSGRIDEANAILSTVEKIAGPLGVFAEEVDARSGTFLGNTPLLFSQVEYVRAILELERRQSV